MAYNKRPSKSSPLPGASIKGAGALPPGTYKGYFEASKAGLSFVSMPHGFHVLEELAPEVATLIDEGKEYTVRVALSEGCIVARTDGGRFYFADAHTKAALTSQHADIHACLIEAAGHKPQLKLATPVVVEILSNDTVIFQRNSAN